MSQRYGELFYGLYKRKCLIDIDFFVNDLVHPVLLRSMLSGEVFVCDLALYTKRVTNAVFLWTYLCAKDKCSNSQDIQIEQKLLNGKNNHSGPLKFIVERTIYYHYYTLLSSFKAIKHSNLSQFLKNLACLLQLFYLIRSAIWSIYTSYKYPLGQKPSPETFSKSFYRKIWKKLRCQFFVKKL